MLGKRFLLTTLLALTLIGNSVLVAEAQTTAPIPNPPTTPPTTVPPTTNTEDGDPVKIVEDISQTSATLVIQNTLTAQNTAKIAEGIEALVEKEKTLDPNAWQVSKELQQQLISGTLEWLAGAGAPGQSQTQTPGQGQTGVPFVQNYSQYRQAVIDKVAGSYLFDNKAGDTSGQCNVESSHKVRTAVYNSYLRARQAAQQGGALSCNTEENTDSENTEGYDNVLHQILSDVVNCRDELCQVFEGQKELYSRAAMAEQNELEAVRNAQGFKPQRVCQNSNDTSGQNRQTCQIVSPPSLAADVASFGLVQLPGLSLLNVDEFDEVVSNTMSNLTNQMINNQNGALGLSSNPEYSQNTFGENGNLSYADALASEDLSQYQTGDGADGSGNPIAKKLKVEQKFESLMQKISDTIKEIENKHERNKQEFNRCYDLEMPNKLVNTKKDADKNLENSAAIIEILTDLNQRYQSASDGASRNDVLRAFMELKNQDIFHTNSENQEIELSFINLTLQQWVETFKYDMALERKKCGGSFDYEGGGGGGDN